jgi:hypothetical protein
VQAKDRKSGLTVALKLYRMHKLNDISSHQVAREVRRASATAHDSIRALTAYASGCMKHEVHALLFAAAACELMVAVFCATGPLAHRAAA